MDLNRSQISFLRYWAGRVTRREMTERFNLRYGISAACESIRWLCRKRGWPCCPASLRPCSSWTRKKGRPNGRGWPLGTAKLDKEGFVVVKTGPQKWKRKHVMVWEAANGALPPGRVIIFADGDCRNFDLDNLIDLAWFENLYMACRGLKYNNADLTRAAIKVARLNINANRRQSSQAAREHP